MGCGPSSEEGKAGKGPGKGLKERRKTSRYEQWQDHPDVKQYELVKALGHGGYSEVHLGRHKRSGAVVAIKVVDLSGDAGITEDAADVLDNEARMLPMLDHPHIVRCHKVLVTRRHVVMLLESCGGGTLLATLAATPHDGSTLVTCVFAQLMRAVQYCHGLGIAHRDIKPENIMFGGGPNTTTCGPVGGLPDLKLIDFGLAAIVAAPASQQAGAKSKPSSTVSAMHGVAGSPGYIAPEVICGKPHTTAMDIWSCGALLFTLLTGCHLFGKLDTESLFYGKKSINDAPGIKNTHFTELPEPARKLILWMLADDPCARPSAAQVLTHPYVTGVCGSTSTRNTDAIRARFAEIQAMRRDHGLAYAMRLQASREAVARHAQAQAQQHDGEWLRQQARLHRAKSSKRRRAQAEALGLPLPSISAVPEDADTEAGGASARGGGTSADGMAKAGPATTHTGSAARSATAFDEAAVSPDGISPMVDGDEAPPGADAAHAPAHAAAGARPATASSQARIKQPHAAPPRLQVHGKDDALAALTHAVPLDFGRADTLPAGMGISALFSPSTNARAYDALMPRAMSIEPLAATLNGPGLHGLVAGSSGEVIEGPQPSRPPAGTAPR